MVIGKPRETKGEKMKKISFVAIIATIMAIPAFADIAANNNNPTCDSTTIGATSGDTALDATWNANTLNLKFMANGQQFASNTCTYGQNITIPTGTPTRTGYNFAGWKVHEEETVSYVGCVSITDETTCNAYADHECYWYNNRCYANYSYEGTSRVTQEWCEADNGNWCDDEKCYDYGSPCAHGSDIVPDMPDGGYTR